MDGRDFDVWYEGIIIGNVKAFSQNEALIIAHMIYGIKVDVKPS